jgi:hypothetical protein
MTLRERDQLPASLTPEAESRQAGRAVVPLSFVQPELAMTCFGLLWLAISAYGFIMLGFSGAGLSLAAVLCMTRPRARQFFTGPDAVRGAPDPDAPSGPAGFCRLALASQRLKHGAAADAMLDRVIPSIARSSVMLAGAACLVLAGCGTQVYTPASTAAKPPAPGSSATASQAQSLRSLESERNQVARQYWPATSVVMKAVPGMQARLGIRLRFEEAFGTFTSCSSGAGGGGLQYQVAVIIEASGHLYQDLGPPLGQAARIAEKALTAAGWEAFSVSQGVWVAAEHDGVSASFDNDPAATESETSFATALLYFLAGGCVPVPGSVSTAPGGGSQAGGGPDAGPPPGDVSAGDGLPPVRDSYGLGPATVPALAQPTVMRNNKRT